jgi:uncharacterized membrane protein YdjX (TVP38/TMEM64 family)
MKKSAVIKVVIILLVIAGLIWFSYGYLDLTPKMIQEKLLSLGFIAPFVFVVLFTLRPLIFFPVTPVAIAGGLAFGAVEGSLACIIGSTSGAVLSFWISRKFGKGLRKFRDVSILEKLEEQMASRGFIYVFFVRLLPFVPYDVVSYASGISRIRFRDYFIATLIGGMPLQVIYCIIGSGFATGNITGVIIAAVILLIVTGLLLFYRKKMDWYA